MNSETSDRVTATERQAAGLVAAAIVVAAVVGWAPMLKAWWFGDDWRLLAAAAGLPIGSSAADTFPGPALYWRVMYPVFGLATLPYTLTRLALHAGSALFVARLARRAGAGGLPVLLAGLVYAAAPLAFALLYPASGIAPLLAVCLGLWALDRWLATGARNVAAAALLGLLALCCGPAALLVPLLLAATLRAASASDEMRGRGFVVAVVGTGAVALVTLAETPTSRTLALYGREMLAGGMTVIAAALVTIAWLLRRTRLARRDLSATVLLTLAALVAAASWSGASLRLSARDTLGRPTDDMVAQAATSYGATWILSDLPRDAMTAPEGGLIFLQSPPPGELDELANRLGDDWIVHSGLYDALAGVWGPRLILGPEVTIAWRNNLKRGPLEALVLVDTELGPLHWGSARQALTYVTLTHVAQQRYESARLHLLRASLIAGDNLSFYYDPGLMIVEGGDVAAHAAEFLAWLAGSDKTTIEVRGLQTNFVNLLRTVVGDEVAAAACVEYNAGR